MSASLDSPAVSLTLVGGFLLFLQPRHRRSVTDDIPPPEAIPIGRSFESFSVPPPSSRPSFCMVLPLEHEVLSLAATSLPPRPPPAAFTPTIIHAYTIRASASYATSGRIPRAVQHSQSRTSNVRAACDQGNLPSLSDAARNIPVASTLGTSIASYGT